MNVKTMQAVFRKHMDIPAIQHVSIHYMVQAPPLTEEPIALTDPAIIIVMSVTHVVALTVCGLTANSMAYDGACTYSVLYLEFP